MKYINIKKLLIKFMGGGLINFPTRFLRWIKIDGDLEGDDSGSGGSTEIDYEAIYQFYKKEIPKIVPEELLQQSIIPEHYTDIEKGSGSSTEYSTKFGIWKGEPGESDTPLFIDFSNVLDIPIIYFGKYIFIDDAPE